MKRAFLGILSILLCFLSACGISEENKNGLSAETPVVSDSAPSQAETIAGTLRLDGRRYTYSGEEADIAVEHDTVTIRRGGVYRIVGNLSEGCLRIAAEKTEVVHVILAGVTLRSSYGTPLCIDSAACVILELSEGSVNTLTDAVRIAQTGSAPIACLYAACHLIVRGTGSLVIGGRQENAVTCMGELMLEGGSLTVSASKVGIWVRDKLSVRDGTLTVTSAQKGMVASADPHAAGTIELRGGRLTVVASQTALEAGKALLVSGGCADLKAPVPYTAALLRITVPDWGI